MAGGTELVLVGRHRLAATVYGRGAPAVVVEPAFGGCAADWEPIAERLAAETTVVLYDRAPYGASSAAHDRRSPRDIAADLDGLLGQLEVTGPLVLAGHSAGGVYVRAYAAAHPDKVAGMVLVDSSHEGQRAVLDPLRAFGARVSCMLTIPSIVGESLESRRGGDRRSIIREWRAFRQATRGRDALPTGALGDRPLVVLTCAPGDPAVPRHVWEAWHELHVDLAGLSADSRHVVSGSPDHYLNRGDPDLIVSAIADVVRAARDGAPLGEIAVAAEAG